VFNWKKADKKNNVYDEATFIDVEHLKQLLDANNGCCSQCNSTLTFSGKSTARLSVVDSSLGHIKGNCVFKCQTCNTKKGVKRKREEEE
jgi:hypothetical protein